MKENSNFVLKSQKEEGNERCPRFQFQTWGNLTTSKKLQTLKKDFKIETLTQTLTRELGLEQLRFYSFFICLADCLCLSLCFWLWCIPSKLFADRWISANAFLPLNAWWACWEKSFKSLKTIPWKVKLNSEIRV